MASWQLQHAKARFSEFLDAAQKDGPQVVTRRGVETAVMVEIREWRRIQRLSRPGLKALLLEEGPRYNNLAPPRRRFRRRPLLRLK